MLARLLSDSHFLVWFSCLQKGDSLFLSVHLITRNSKAEGVTGDASTSPLQWGRRAREVQEHKDSRGRGRHLPVSDLIYNPISDNSPLTLIPNFFALWWRKIYNTQFTILTTLCLLSHVNSHSYKREVQEFYIQQVSIQNPLHANVSRCYSSFIYTLHTFKQNALSDIFYPKNN